VAIDIGWHRVFDDPVTVADGRVLIATKQRLMVSIGIR
jgi:hypothetical protein